jgi:Tfp pilus assembly protein PilO
MSRPILSTILIVISIITFFYFIDPTYKEVKTLSAKSAQFDEALVRSRELQSVRDSLLSRYNTFSSENLNKIEKLLPDNVDNIRLILDLDGIASQYGIVVKNLSISGGTTSQNDDESNGGIGEVVAVESALGEIGLSFDVTTSYENFKKFMRDLEQSLRIVDIKRLDIESQGSAGDLLKFSLDIRTYWLK